MFHFRNLYRMQISFNLISQFYLKYFITMDVYCCCALKEISKIYRTFSFAYPFFYNRFCVDIYFYFYLSYSYSFVRDTNIAIEIVSRDGESAMICTFSTTGRWRTSNRRDPFSLSVAQVRSRTRGTKKISGPFI